MDTVKEVKRASLPQDVALITATIPRERIVLAQTPQVFSDALLRDAFRKAQEDGVTASDEAALVERLGHDVYVVLGSERNLKITRPADMDLAQFYLEQERQAGNREHAERAARMTHSGIGYDLHRLAEGRKLMIGGIEVPFEKGSVGHSDGDVLATRCAMRFWARRASAISARTFRTRTPSGKAHRACFFWSTFAKCLPTASCASFMSTPS